MSQIDLNWKYIKHSIKGSYNDLPIKLHTIKMAPLVLGFEVELNPNPKGVDLRAKHDHSIGVEVERAWVIGDYWKDLYHSFLSKLGFATLNMPYRKEKYYLPYYRFNGELIDNRDKMDKIIFIRWNWDGSQANIVYAHIVHNQEKLHRSDFTPKNNVDEEGMSEEQWLCFKKEDVVVKNLQLDGRYVQDTEPDGAYVPLSEDEIIKQQNEIEEEKVRIAKEKWDEGIRRIKELKSQKK